MDPITLLAAFGPLVVDLGKSLIGKFVNNGEFKPSTIDDYIKVKQFDLDMFRTMNEAGGTNSSYPWVEAIIRLQRPAVACVALLAWMYTVVTNQPNEGVNNFAAAVGFYLFGDRTLFYSRKLGK